MASASSPPSEILVPAPAEDLCLNFANTRYWRGSDPATETLSNAGDLDVWLKANAPMPVPGGGKKSRGEGFDLDAMFDAALALRESIYAIFLAIGEGKPPPNADLSVFNQALAKTPRKLGVSARDDAYAWVVEPPSASLGDALAPVLWSAADLLTQSASRRIRRCANDKCQWVFIDSSKGGTPRWFDKSACGNRAKSHRHYARSKKA
jgi:predicted RNA-binding Zn ribbon-like protein